MSEFSPAQLAFKVCTPDEDFNKGLNPIIFLHGIIGSKEHFKELSKIVANATKRKVYAVDARNHGDSEWTEFYNFDINVDDLLHFMDDMAIEKAVLIGQSMGGITAIKAALKSPEKFEKIAVEDMGVKGVPDGASEIILVIVEISQEAVESLPPELDESDAKQFILSYIYYELSKKPKRILDEFSRIVGKSTVGFNTDLVTLRRQEDGKLTFGANLHVIGRMLRDKESMMSPVEGLYPGPACFIYGNISIFDIGSQVDEIKEHFPNATFVAIEGATHTVHMDKPEEFNAALLRFLS